MDFDTFVDPNLTIPDSLVLRSLLQDLDVRDRTAKQGLSSHKGFAADGATGASNSEKGSSLRLRRDSNPNHSNTEHSTIQHLKDINNPQHEDFTPTVLCSWDMEQLMSPGLKGSLLRSYINYAKKIVRVETDVIMVTHLLLYFATSVPSAAFLFYHFTWAHGILHWLMQTYYVGSYTLMMHQHIHMSGILSRKFWYIDKVFPYVLDPLMGHTWRSYFHHHVKHHHVEGNGPDDLSSTIYYQRDDIWDFLRYVGRFYFFVWFELPLYFLRKGKRGMALKACCWEIGNYAFIYLLYQVNPRATVFVLVLPLMLLRFALMVGNWGQHSLVDEIDPNSDFRSSITLIDVASNRFCFNDGYHTSHHLNPRRHWREHPVAFMMQKERYSNENALVFANIDYMMMTYKLLRKDYMHLAKCLVPIGSQVGMSLEQLADVLRAKTRRFTEEDIQRCFRSKQ